MPGGFRNVRGAAELAAVAPYAEVASPIHASSEQVREPGIWKGALARPARKRPTLAEARGQSAATPVERVTHWSSTSYDGYPLTSHLGAGESYVRGASNTRNGLKTYRPVGDHPLQGRTRRAKATGAPTAVRRDVNRWHTQPPGTLAAQGDALRTRGMRGQVACLPLAGCLGQLASTRGPAEVVSRGLSCLRVLCTRPKAAQPRATGGMQEPHRRRAHRAADTLPSPTIEGRSRHGTRGWRSVHTEPHPWSKPSTRTGARVLTMLRLRGAMLRPMWPWSQVITIISLALALIVAGMIELIREVHGDRPPWWFVPVVLTWWFGAALVALAAKRTPSSSPKRGSTTVSPSAGRGATGGAGAGFWNSCSTSKSKWCTGNDEWIVVWTSHEHTRQAWNPRAPP